MKNKNIWIAVAIVVIVGVGWWYYNQPASFGSLSNEINVDSLTAIDGTLGMFATDADSLYFIDIEQKKDGETYKTTKKPILVSGSDKDTFVVDNLGSSGDTVILNAHDAKQSYIAKQIRFGCYGDTQGCIESSSLDITPR
jgi:hypothetical protein